MSTNDTSGLITRPKPIPNNATPPGNGNMADALARLYNLAGNEPYRYRLAKLLATLTPPESVKALQQLPTLIGFEILNGGIQIFITGEGAVLVALRRAAIDHAPSARLIVSTPSGAKIPSAQPAHCR